MEVTYIAFQRAASTHLTYHLMITGRLPACSEHQSKRRKADFPLGKNEPIDPMTLKYMWYIGMLYGAIRKLPKENHTEEQQDLRANSMFSFTDNYFSFEK